jgi:two-component system chemotaxis sensor kinase CheA
MYIDDDELRLLYKASSGEHFETIETGLIHLEKSPEDGDRLNLILRALHSLKGDSRMLGVLPAEQVVHQMESLLIEVQEGTYLLSAELCDRLYQGLDAVRKLAVEATTGAPSGVNLTRVLAQLELPSKSEAGQPVVDFTKQTLTGLSLDLDEPDLDEPDLDDAILVGMEHPLVDLLDPRMVLAEEPSAPVEVPEGNAAAVAASPTPQYQIESVRVDAQKLDVLITQADELTVTKLRIARRLDDLTAFMNQWEEWARELMGDRLFTGTVSAASTTQTRGANSVQLLALSEALREMRLAAIEDTARLETVSARLDSGIRNLRLLPLSSIFGIFPRLVRDLAREQGKLIELVLEGGDTLADKRILEELKDPLTHLLRNAIDHGIETTEERLTSGKPETATIRLRGFQVGDRIGVEITDDGQGLDLDKIKKTARKRSLHSDAELAVMSTSQLQNLIFAPGFSTKETVTAISGRGVGLDVVRANVERLKGSIIVQSEPGQGCLFRLLINANLASTHALIASVQGYPFAIPIDAVETLLLLNRDDIFALEGKPTIRWNQQPTSVIWLSDLLNLPVQAPDSVDAANVRNPKLSCVLLKVDGAHVGLLVDSLVDQQHLVLKPKHPLLATIALITGAAILGNGEICQVLDPQQMVLAVKGTAQGSQMENLLAESVRQSKILLVEDSIPIRTQVKRILEGAGYEVTAAVDGLDGFNKLKGDRFDAVVSDVEMPNLSGLELTSRIRQYREYDELPIILVTTLAKESDKRRGADAGANAYLTKGDFDQSLLLNTLRRLI